MKQDTLLEFAAKKGFISTQDALTLGISRRYLYKLAQKGVLHKTAKGLFSTVPENSVSEFFSTIEICRRIPHCVVSLLTALSIHEISTQLPNAIWLTIPTGMWKPTIVYPPVNFTFCSAQYFNVGIEIKTINNNEIKVTTIARTVADCFKFRRKVGLDVAIEALKEVIEHKRVSLDELVIAAKHARVQKIVQPYIEALV